MTYRIHSYQPQTGDIPAQNKITPSRSKKPFDREEAIFYMKTMRNCGICALAHDENGKILSLEEVKAA